MILGRPIQSQCQYWHCYHFLMAYRIATVDVGLQYETSLASIGPYGKATRRQTMPVLAIYVQLGNFTKSWKPRHLWFGLDWIVVARIHSVLRLPCAIIMGKTSRQSLQQFFKDAMIAQRKIKL